MDAQQRKNLLKDTFDTLAAGYDAGPLRFFPLSAEQLAACLELRGDEHILDVATGTGHAALALAARVPRGKVTGVDFSRGMLEQARAKASSPQVHNVEFLERDMQELGFPAGGFDAAVCSFGIFFAEDMDSQLAHISAVVKPKGQVVITSFQENYFGRLRELMAARLSGYGVQMQPQTWKRVATEAGCRALFAQAGLRDIRVDAKNVGYFLSSADEWWAIVWNAGFRRLVGQLTPADQERFRREHLDEVAALETAGGIWLDVGVLFTTGTKV